MISQPSESQETKVLLGPTLVLVKAPVEEFAREALAQGRSTHWRRRTDLGAARLQNWSLLLVQPKFSSWTLCVKNAASRHPSKRRRSQGLPAVEEVSSQLGTLALRVDLLPNSAVHYHLFRKGDAVESYRYGNTNQPLPKERFEITLTKNQSRVEFTSLDRIVALGDLFHGREFVRDFVRDLGAWTPPAYWDNANCTFDLSSWPLYDRVDLL